MATVDAQQSTANNGAQPPSPDELALSTVRTWFENLKDKELGPIGPAFAKAAGATGAREAFAHYSMVNATYKAFIYPPHFGQRNFTNEIEYGASAFGSTALLFSGRALSFMHAIRNSKAVAMHADPFNAETSVMLSPRDYMRRLERIKQDANAKEAWFGSLAAQDHPEMREATRHYILPVETFETLRAQSPTLEETMHQAAIAAAASQGHWSSPNSTTPAAETWHKMALDEYESTIHRRLAAGEEIAFVRMTEEDELALGDTFGPNPFGKDGRLYKEFAEPLNLSEENRKRLEALEQKIGIADNAQLPTIAEGLWSVHRLTPEEFIAQSRRENTVAYVARWMDAAADPELGKVGKDFNAAIATTNSREEEDLSTNHNAVYTAYVYPPLNGENPLKNKVVYGDTALKNLALLSSGRSHEHIHALQVMKAAALHADPFNPDTDLMLSPREYLRRKRLLEQDAYAKDAWLSSLVAKEHPDLRKLMETSVLPVSAFEKIRKKAKDLPDALRQAANDVAKRTVTLLFGTTHKRDVTAADSWDALALKEYVNIIRERVKEGRKITFVCMDEQDVLDIGSSFGPNTFGRDGKAYAEFMEKNVLAARHEKALKALNKLLGIKDEAALPTIREALAQRKDTAENFLRTRKSRGENNSPPRDLAVQAGPSP